MFITSFDLKADIETEQQLFKCVALNFQHLK